MRYLQRQRKSVISDIGFKGSAGILLMLVMLLSALFSGEFLISTDFDRTGMQEQQISTVSSVMEGDLYTTRESGGKTAELFGSTMIRQPLHVVRNKITGIAIIMLPAVLPELFKQFWSLGCKDREEILPRGMLLVHFMRIADGKKNGLAISIK